MGLLKRLLLYLCGIRLFGTIPPGGMACSHSIQIENLNGEVIEVWIKPFQDRRKEERE